MFILFLTIFPSCSAPGDRSIITEVITEAIGNANIQTSASFHAAGDFVVHFHKDLIEEHC